MDFNFHPEDGRKAVVTVYDMAEYNRISSPLSLSRPFYIAFFSEVQEAHRQLEFPHDITPTYRQLGRIVGESLAYNVLAPDEEDIAFARQVIDFLEKRRQALKAERSKITYLNPERSGH